MSKEQCADAIAMFQGKLVLVERLSEPKGLALPGGRRDITDGVMESAADCAIREFKEETGLTLAIDGELGVYDAPGRDPRGPKTTTVLFGTASGTLRDERGKTRVILMELSVIDQHKSRFAFDHYQIIEDWMGVTRKNSNRRRM